MLIAFGQGRLYYREIHVVRFRIETIISSVIVRILDLAFQHCAYYYSNNMQLNFALAFLYYRKSTATILAITDQGMLRETV